jgi:hypothetical protein
MALDKASGHQYEYEYDFPTAVTFLLAGLGLGSILTLLFASRDISDRSLILSSGASARAAQ